MIVNIPLTFMLASISFFAVIDGTVEIGFSASLQSRQSIAKQNWTLLNGWTCDDMLLLFDYGLQFDETKTSVTVPLGGLYFIAATLAVNAKSTPMLRVCITANNCQATDQNETSIAIAFTCYLYKGQNVHIRIHGNSQFTVNTKSKFSMQYLGSSSSMPGFISSLKRNSTIQITNHTYGVILNGFDIESGPYIGSQVKRNILSENGIFSVECDGLYLISASINMLSNKGTYELRIAGSSVISKYYNTVKRNGISMSTIVFIAALTKKDKISLVMLGPETNIIILQNTKFSAVYIGPMLDGYSEFNVMFPDNVNFASGRHLNYLTDFIPAKLLKEKSIRIANNEKYQFAMPRNGIYLISLLLHINKSIHDEIIVKIAVWNAGIETLVKGGASDGSSLSRKKTMLASALLTSVVSLGNSYFVTITLKSKLGHSFTILKTSQVSVTLIRTGVLAAAFNVKGGQSQKKETGSFVKILTLTAVPYQPFSLNRFLSNRQVLFRCPLRGFYLVTLNMILTGTQPESQEIQLFIGRRYYRPDQQQRKNSTILNATYSISNAASSYNPSIVYSLQENDRLFFFIDSKFPFIVNDVSYIFLSFIGYPESGRTVIAKMSNEKQRMLPSSNTPYLFQYWFPDIQGSRFFINNKYTTLEAGYYLISCTFQLQIDFTISIRSLKAMLIVHFSGNDPNFGLTDMYQLSGFNKSKTITLNVNGVLESKGESELITLLKITEHSLNITILDARLSVSFYSSKHHALTNSFRFVVASTKLLSLDNDEWKYIGKNVQKNENGEFKTSDVEFVGPHFLTKQPVVGIAKATTRIQGVDGNLEFGVVVISGSEIVSRSDLRIETNVQGGKETTLKWNGLVYLEPWQQLSLAVRRKEKISKSNKKPEVSQSRSSWSSLSFLSLTLSGFTGSSSNFMSKKTFISDSKATIMSDGLYMMRQLDVKSASSSYNESQMTFIEWCNKGQRISPSIISVDPVPFSKLKNVRHFDTKDRKMLTGKSLYCLDDIFTTTEHVISSANNDSECTVDVLSVIIRVSYTNCSKLSLVHQTNRKQLTLAFSYHLSSYSRALLFSGAFCFRRRDKICIFCEKETFEIDVVKGSKISFSQMDIVRNVEGFSSMQTKNQQINLSKDISRRIDVWSMNSSFCFDSSFGFKSPFGSYLITTTGQYLVTAYISFGTSLASLVHLNVNLDGSDTPQISSSLVTDDHETSTISIVAIANIEKGSLLQISLTANVSINVDLIAGSSFSVLLIDQEITATYCAAENISLRTVVHNRTALRIGGTIVIPCESGNEKFVDFYWLHNNQVIRFIPSSVNGTLIIKDANANHSGVYVCRIQVGDYTVASKGTDIFVYDPTPVISVQNSDVFIAENSVPGQTLMRLKVKAFTSQGTEDAVIQLSILPYNLRHKFHVYPNETSSYAELRASISFDFEVQKLFLLKIKARNENFEGQAESQIELCVHVTDENDNAPIFKKRNYKIAMYENATVGDEIYQLVATDRDSIKNARINYFLHQSEDAQYFVINKTSGVVSLVKSIIKEGKRSYTLFVIAKNEPFKTFATLSVSILDVNNNRPYFNPDLYIINITEQTIVGSVIAKLEAFDLDREQDDDRLRYNIISTNNTNVINVDKRGFIRISVKLWEYAGQQLVYKAQTYDDGGLKGSNEATIILNVIESFSKAYSTELRFEKESYLVKVKEDVPVGSCILQIKAHFPISSIYVLKYVCIRSADSGNFSLSESTGNLYTRYKLDYEAIRKYSFKVLACDIEGKTACTVANVIVEIEDTDDHSPTFTKLFYNITIAMNTTIHSLIFQVHAQDSDVGRFGEIFYKIESDSYKTPFAIERRDGIIRVVQTLNTTNPYILVISASNAATPRIVRYCILQVNIVSNYGRENVIHSPFFAKEQYMVNISEETTLNTLVVNATAIINDDDDKIQYFLYGDNNSTFKIDDDVGSIYLNSKLDFEVLSRYDLILIAEANNDVTRRGATRITVKVIDANDNRPIFINSNQQTYYQQDARPGSLVTRMNAYDRDDGANSDITYSIETKQKHFTLNSMNGDLRIRSVSVGMAYNISINACDHGITPLCSTANIMVYMSKARNSHSVLKSQLIASNHTTSLTLQFDIDEYIPKQFDTILLRFIAQEIHNSHPEYQMYTELPAINWYRVNYQRHKHNNFLRRFVASESFFTPTSKRKRRETSMVDQMKTTTTFIYGNGRECDRNWMVERICNGPLRPATQYRFQLEIKYDHSSQLIKTAFTQTYKTGIFNTPKTLPVKSKPKFPWWTIFITVSVLLAVVLLSLVIFCCVYCWKCKRRKIPQNYHFQITKTSSPEEYFLPRKTETECQELTLWFSEESIFSNSTHKPSATEKITDV